MEESSTYVCVRYDIDALKGLGRGLRFPSPEEEGNESSLFYSESEDSDFGPNCPE